MFLYNDRYTCRYLMNESRANYDERITTDETEHIRGFDLCIGIKLVSLDNLHEG